MQTFTLTTYIDNDQLVEFNIFPDQNIINVTLKDLGMGTEYALARLIGGKYEWISERNRNLYFSLFKKHHFLKRHLIKATKLLIDNSNDNDIKVRMQCLKRRFIIQVSKVFR